MWGRLASSIFICAGDISGDQHAARLVAKLKQTNPDLQVWGVGGSELRNEGAELLYNADELTIIGIVGVLRMLPMLAKVRARLLAEIEARKPDTVLLVDYGGFNLNLARMIRRRYPELPIVYFISPQVWGSRPWRINTIAETVSKMLVIFPFEETLYRARSIDAHFVGHPLTDRYASVSIDESKQAFCDKYGIDASKPVVGIFPGSRRGEIRNFMPVLLKAIGWLHADRPQVQFLISQANPKIAEHIYEALQKARKIGQEGSLIKLVSAEDNRGLMAASDVLWTKSGTITLEAAFMERPMLVYYRGDWLSFVLFFLFKRVKYISWPNLLAGKMLVPELIQLDCRAEQLVRYTRDLLDVPAARRQICEDLRTVKAYLNKGDFATNAAVELETVLNSSSPKQLKVAD